MRYDLRRITVKQVVKIVSWCCLCVKSRVLYCLLTGLKMVFFYPFLLTSLFHKCLFYTPQA